MTTRTTFGYWNAWIMITALFMPILIASFYSYDCIYSHHQFEDKE